MRNADPQPTSQKPGILLLEATQGGVVNNPGVAKRWGKLALKSIGGRINRPPAIHDDGDSWLLSFGDHPASQPSSIQIRKRDAAVLLAPDFAPDILSSRQSVQSFAALVIANASSEAALERQLPLRIEDKGDRWLVSGTRGSGEGPGPCHIEILKKNGRVLDMWFEWVMAIPESVKILLRGKPSTDES